MNHSGSGTVRISAEYERRVRELLAGFYAWSKPSNLLMHRYALRGCIAMLDRARQRLPQADVRAGHACSLPWPDQSFDLVSQFTLFTSMPDPTLKRAVAVEMVRVLKPGGAILWFDFRANNPANPQVRGVPAREIRSLFAGCEVELAPVLRTHYAGVIRKCADTPDQHT